MSVERPAIPGVLLITPPRFLDGPRLLLRDLEYGPLRRGRHATNRSCRTITRGRPSAA